MTPESPSKSSVASRLKAQATMKTRSSASTLVGSGGATSRPARPPSRTAASPAPSSPAKPSNGPAGKLTRTLSRPLWNSGRGASSSTATSASPVKGGPTARVTRTKAAASAADASFANATFVSAISGCETSGRENRPSSPNKPPVTGSPAKDLKRQPSLLAGLGFGRSVHSGGRGDSKTGIPVQAPFDGGASLTGYDAEREPIKAYLRIRPPLLSAAPRQQYLHIVNNTDVLLAPPSATPNVDASSRYKFTQVYGPQVSQQDFFKSTTLPLVKDLLNGKSGLCFAYGVTASGKTYTIQGGLEKNPDGSSCDPGLLPRTMDVLFNSIEGKQTNSALRPARITGVELSQSTGGRAVGGRPKSSATEIDHSADDSGAILTDPTVLEVDDQHEYSVWISYAEIYNEKIYDLLEAPASVSPSASTTSLHSFTTNLAEQVKHAAQQFSARAAGNGGVLKRKALSLKHDKSSGLKYVSGLTELRVWSAEEAKALLRKGQINRTVFSTFANRTSSRSHGVFTIRVLRVPIPPPGSRILTEEAMSRASTARLSIVDLAGSERTRNTQTTGDRLKEAGNINKSLMVLGQCMEVLRRNQDLVSKGKKPNVVPFRHSKLTELFQSFFESGEAGGLGGGKAVMIVNANPCDTGYDENSHVMKFSAVASEVVTVRQKDQPQPLLSSLVSSDRGGMERAREKVLTSVSLAKMAGQGLVPDEDSFIIEEEDEEDEEDEEVESADVFVDHLLDQISAMRVQLVEAEIRANLIEARVREQVMYEMNIRMLEMEEAFARRLHEEAEEAELKTDRKIDILSRAAARANRREDEGMEDGSLLESGAEDEEDGDEDEDEDEDEATAGEISPPPSPTPGAAPISSADVSVSSAFESALSAPISDSEREGCEDEGDDAPVAEISASQIPDSDEAVTTVLEDSVAVTREGSQKVRPKRQLRNTRTGSTDG